MSHKGLRVILVRDYFFFRYTSGKHNRGCKENIDDGGNKKLERIVIILQSPALFTVHRSLNEFGTFILCQT